MRHGRRRRRADAPRARIGPWNSKHTIAPSEFFNERRTIMFRRFLIPSVGALTLLVVLGAPGPVHAQRMRGSFSNRVMPGFGGGMMTPVFRGGMMTPGFRGGMM